MKSCEDCIHYSIVTRYDYSDHDRAYDLARCGLTGEETDDPNPCDEWTGDVDSMQAHIDGLQDELARAQAETARVRDDLEKVERRHDRLCDELAERYMPLPVDMYGVPIRLHDKMEAGDGMTFPVKSIHFTSEDWDDGSWWVNEARFNPKELRHYHEPTIEDVLQEFGDWYAYTKGGCDEDGIIAEYADKLRGLMEVE